MHWSIQNDAPFGAGYKIYVDGEEIPNVVAFDMDEGWVQAHKLDKNGNIVVCDRCCDVVTDTYEGQVALEGPEVQS